MELNSREGTITEIVVVHATRWEEGILPNFSLRHGPSRSLLGVLPPFFSFSCGAPFHATNGKWSSPQVGRFVYKFKPKVQFKARTHPKGKVKVQSNAMGLLFRVRKLIINSPECEIICQSRWTKPEPMNSTFKGVPIPSWRTAQPLLSQKNLLFLFLCSLGHGVTARNAPTTLRNYLPVLEIEWNGVPARNSKCEHEFPHYLPLVSIRRRKAKALPLRWMSRNGTSIPLHWTFNQAGRTEAKDQSPSRALLLA